MRDSSILIKSSFIDLNDACFNPKTFELRSKDCLVENACPVFKLLSSTKIIISEVGNPGYKLCYQLEGVPYQIKIKIRNKNEDISVCATSNKKSYIDLENLLKFYYRQ
jgi:hypothetical protein